MGELEKIIDLLPWRIKGDYRLQIRKYNNGNTKYQVAYFDLNLNLKKDFFAPSLREAIDKMNTYLSINPELLIL